MIPELNQFETGYWRFSPSGIPFPGFLCELLIYPRYQEHFSVRLAQFGLNRWLVPFALEVEHRKATIATLNHLGEALSRIAAAQYDFAPATALRRQCLQALDEFNRAQHRRPAVLSEEAKFMREIEQKELPTGPEANLALVRSLLASPRPAVQAGTHSPCADLMTPAGK